MWLVDGLEMKYARNMKILVNGRQWLAQETREFSCPVSNVLNWVLSWSYDKE
ncbi:hypothetical protein C0J52_27166 [Blattella germanica]|nr:hypothetical protein C0J52_27166 [Blattella germanica]